MNEIKNPFWKVFFGVIIAVLIICAFGIAGAGDLEEAQRQEEEYCANVKSGTWPDFNDTYKYCKR